MRIWLKTFDGHTLNDSDLRAGLISAPPPAADPNFLKQARADAVYTGTYTVAERSLAVAIQVLDYADRYAWRRTLLRWFKRGAAGTLVATLEDGEDYQLGCVVVSITQDKTYPAFYTAVLQTGQSAWRAVSVETDSWVADESGDEKVITVGGTEATRLSLTIQPTEASSGDWAYQDLYRLVNVPAINYGRRAWCIELDTDALVTAGKMQADCDDLRIVINDREVPRWIADANDANTKVWFNVNIGPGYSLKLKTAVADSGAVGELLFKVDSTHKKAISLMPASGMVYHGTEWFQYSGKDVNTCRLNITTRGALGTTLQAHSANDTFKHIENVIYLLYGNADATDPADDDEDYDNEKPIFNLSDSDNENWVYDATTGFYDAANPNRPGSWQPVLSTTGKESAQYLYTEEGDSEDDPAMGMAMKCWVKAGRWQNETATVAWVLNCPGSFSVVSATGQKYRNTVKYPSKVGLQRSLDGKRWSDVWTEATPLTASSWTAVNQADKSTPSAPKFVRFVMTGSLAALADAMAAFEILTATAEFTSASLPAGSLIAEQDNYTLAVVIENETTGDAVTINYPVPMDKTLVLDGEAYTLTLDGVNAHGALTLDDESRAEWLRLEPGSNTLKITAEEMGELTMGLSWYPRIL